MKQHVDISGRSNPNVVVGVESYNFCSLGRVFVCIFDTLMGLVGLSSTESHMQDMHFGKNKKSDQHKESVKQTFSNLTCPHDSATYIFSVWR